mmetsp:Transcript_2107/g.6075  ORF Transcript_2107/g.6075 Transcript_2107/m.6075 type:complete len:390 (-) Transcript_2107:23-1192(-)
MSASASKRSAPGAGAGPSLGFEAIASMSLLALQFGMQPALTRKYTPPTTCRSAVIIMQECVKFVIAIFMLSSSGQLKPALEGWTVSSWLTIAFLPAALYVVQNLSALMAYQNLHPVTFNVLNQTKTLSAALCCWLIIGRKQSKAQIFALFLLLLSALVIEKIVRLDALLGGNGGGDATSAASESLTAMEPRHFTHGVVPILVASGISGLAGAITQKNLQSATGCGKLGGKNAVLFSAELCVASLIMLGGSLAVNSDGKCIQEKGFFADWTPFTFIPILTNALGGIFVGLVTKYAGSVRKGFALIFGLMVSGLIQAVTEPTNDGTFAISKEEIIGGCLASISLWLHVTNPYKAPEPTVGQKAASNGTASVSAATKPIAKTRRSRRSRKED